MSEQNVLLFHLFHYIICFLQNVHAALLSVSVSLVLQATSMTALSETQINGNEKGRATGEGIQNKSFWLASSYGCTPATSSDVYVKYILWIWGGGNKKSLHSKFQ